MGYRSFDEMIEAVKAKGRKKSCAVVAADTEGPMKAVLRAHKEDLLRPLLIGDEPAVKKCVEKIGGKVEEFRILPVRTHGEAAQMAVDLVNTGEADIILKGSLETSALLAPVIDRKNEFKTSEIITAFSVCEVPTYHKLLAVTDGGITLYPNLKEKKFIIQNAVKALRRMEIPCPKVAVLAALENATPKMPETLDADLLQKMNERKEIENCIVAGPISYDLAINKESAGVKGYTHPVSGDADLLVFPDITSGNLTAKALVYSAGAKIAACAIGAKAPIVLGSRSSPPDDKFRSLILALAVDPKN